MKVGKTSTAAKFPKNLLIAFEKGYNAIDGIHAVDVNKWVEFRQIIKQLEKPEAKEKYSTITIDTTTLAYEMCEQFICAQNGVQSIRDIAWGQGWSMAKKEFDSCLRKICMLGYGLVLISHIETRKEKTADDSEIEILAPSMPKRCYEVVNQIVDIIGYIATEWDEDGNNHRWLYTRQTPTVMAGSRFPYLAPKIKLGYEELVEAVNEAIDKQRDLHGATVVDRIETKQEVVLDFKEVRAKAQELWEKLVGNGDNANPEVANEILKKIEMTMGHKMRLSEFTEDQVDLLQNIVEEMEEMNK